MPAIVTRTVMLGTTMAMATEMKTMTTKAATVTTMAALGRRNRMLSQPARAVWRRPRHHQCQPLPFRPTL